MNLRCIEGCEGERKPNVTLNNPVLSERYMNMNNAQLQKERLLLHLTAKERPLERAVSTSAGLFLCPDPAAVLAGWYGQEILPRWCLWCLLKPEVCWQIRVIIRELLLSWNAVVGSRRPAGCRCLHQKGSADLAESLLSPTEKNRAVL